MPKANYSFKRLIPLIILALALGCFFYFKGYHYLTFSMLAKHHLALAQWTQQHFWQAILLFSLIYIVAVAISIPGASIITLLAGVIFGTIIGSVIVIISATIGAVIIFLAAKTALSGILANKAGPFMKKLEAGFQRDAFSYMLVLRLIPLFPFWLINIVPALLDVDLFTYSVTTFLGIIPGTVVYVAIGSGLTALLNQGQTPNMHVILSPSILLPLVGLAALSLLPVIYKKFKKSPGN